MKHLVHLVLLALLIVGLADTAQAQWSCLYATYDDNSNGTGHNTMSVAVMGEDAFVALVMSRGIRAFLIPYVDADSATGRLYDYGYGSGTADIYQIWTDGGFDQAQMLDPMQVVVDKDNYIYVTSNDANRNVLVFRFQDDTIKTVAAPGTSVFPRQETGSNSIYGLAVSDSGYVYVCNDTSTGVSDDLKVYAPITQWTAFHTDTPVNTIDLPDGEYKGLAVAPDGSVLWVCDYTNRNILRFVGSATGGYMQDMGFSFTLGADDTIPTTPNRPGPIGLTYLPENNILVAAVDSLFHSPGIGYQYCRMYLLDPGTGAWADPDTAVSRIDVAAWNFDKLNGSYTNRVGGTVPGNASGYGSTFDVAADAAGNLYSLSFYGWTIEKWAYDGDLPVVTGVEEIPGELPAEFGLSQNYPNPFNPATTIEFSVPEAGFVSVRIYDLLGQQVQTLVNEQKAPGSYRVTFDATNLPSGTYFYTLHAGSFMQTKKMILMK
jgi:hypothetical protein